MTARHAQHLIVCKPNKIQWDQKAVPFHMHQCRDYTGLPFPTLTAFCHMLPQREIGIG